jgi:AraC-like DNA-binding protein
MGAWLLAVSAVAAIISARVMGWLPGSAMVEHSVNLLGLTTYPLLFLYIRQQTHPSSTLANAWRLWLPLVAYLAVLAVRGAIGTGTGVPFVWLLPILLAFTAACAALVIRREHAGRTGLMPAEWIVGFLVVLNVAQIVRMLFGHVAPIPALVPFVITTGFLAVVGLLAWRAVATTTSAAGAAESPRYEKSGLDDTAARELLDRIDDALTRERVFTDASLTLGRLAAAVDSTPHQVSEVLNRYATVTFHELVNRHRVDEVKKQLCDPAADRYTVEGIGVDVGFGSRSALYAAFRRFEGTTPTAYRRQR